MIARNIEAKVIIAGVDVTRDLSPYLCDITYEDTLSSGTDTIELELQDVEHLFIADWFPQRGDTLEVTLIKNNWEGDGLQETLPLGLFEVDEIENSYPPSRCKLKGNSCPQNSELRQVDESRSWENVKLSAIAADIAGKAGVELVYEAEDDPEIKRAEQAELSALEFLDKLCADHYLSVKFADGKLIIFDTAKLEEQEPIMRAFIYGSSIIKKFSATATLTEIYKDCQVSYKHGKQDELYEATATAPNKQDGKTLKINQKVNSQGEAEKLARHKLREKNREEVKVQITTTGDFSLLSGNVIELMDHGFYSGRYLIEKATHKVGSGYETSLECYRCLEGY